MASSLSSQANPMKNTGHESPPHVSPPPPSGKASTDETTAAFSNLALGPSSQPTVDQCLAHLKLLEAFHQLREDISLTDGLFGLQDSFVPPTADEQHRLEILTKIRGKRWAVYVSKAAKRFEIWWRTMVEPDARMLQQKDIPTAFREDPQNGPALSIDRDGLPPLGEHCFLEMDSI